MSDLTETLRDITSAQGWLACDEAADEIERLTEEAETQVRVMQQVIDDGVKYKAEIQRLTAERDALRTSVNKFFDDGVKYRKERDSLQSKYTEACQHVVKVECDHGTTLGELAELRAKLAALEVNQK